MSPRRVAGAGRSEAEEAPVSAGHTFPGVSLPFVVPTPATPSRSERLAAVPEQPRLQGRRVFVYSYALGKFAILSAPVVQADWDGVMRVVCIDRFLDVRPVLRLFLGKGETFQ